MDITIKDKIAYLKVNNQRNGSLDSECWIDILDYQNDSFACLAPRDKIKDNKLEIRVIAEDRKRALIEVPHGKSFGIYDDELKAYGFLTIKKELIEYST